MRELIKLPRHTSKKLSYETTDGGAWKKGHPICFVDKANTRMVRDTTRLFFITRGAPVSYNREFSVNDDYIWVKIDENNYVVPADGPADREFPLYKYILRDDDLIFG